MPDLRKDPILGRWVIIATERATRPVDFPHEEESMNSKGNCPFCEGAEAKTPPEILAYHPPGRPRDTAGWWVRVVPNKFPALKIEGDLNRQGLGVYDQMNGIGAHEVIIETPIHEKKYFELEDAKAQDVIWAFRERILDLKKDPRVEYILIFKNHGRRAGASLAHPHAQLIALPMVPFYVKEEVFGGKRYFDFKERCVFCDIVKQELEKKSRLIEENKNFISFTPFASRFPLETWIMPKAHQSHFENITKEVLIDLTSIFKSSLYRLDTVLKNPAFNYIIHSAPLRESELAHYHWHIEIIPKLTHVAGFEWGTGFYINPMSPESAAEYLRGANKSC